MTVHYVVQEVSRLRPIAVFHDRGDAGRFIAERMLDEADEVSRVPSGYLITKTETP